MSVDFAAWYSQERINNKAAGELYARLCDGDTNAVLPHPAVDKFYVELIARYPEIDVIPKERLDECPWSHKLDHSPGHVIMTCVSDWANEIDQFVRELARQHGLVIFDPQSGRVTYPDGSSGSTGESHTAFWILGLCALIFAGIFIWSAWIVLSGTSAVFYILAGLCVVMSVACFRQALK
jgi:hypothetical protein